MNLKKSRLLSLATSILVMSASLVGISAGAANAVSAPVTVTFEAGDTSGGALGGTADFGGNVSSVITSTVGANTSQVGKIVNGAECWSGTTFLIKELGDQLISDVSKIVTLDLYSEVAVADVMLKLEGGANKPAREVKVSHTGSGWETLTYDFATGPAFVASDYIKASLFVGFCGAAHPVEVLVDNISFPGATKPDVVIDRTTPSVLVNFETSDTSGYNLIGFGGQVATVETDAAGQGSEGSARSLKVIDQGDCWAGTTFINAGVKASLISAANPVVKANIYSPAAGKTIKMKMESAINGGDNKEVDVTSVEGWRTYSFDFTGFNAAVDYNVASIFMNFTCDSGAKTSSTWYVDDIAFNGAAGAALGSGGGGGGGNTNPTALRVTFESDDSSGAALGGSADFGGNVSSVVTSTVGANSSQVGKIVNGAECWSGTSFLIKDRGNQLISDSSKIVTLDLYSVDPIADVKLKLEGGGSDPVREVDVTHDGGGWQTLTFDFATGPAFAPGNYFKASLFAGFGCGGGNHPAEVLFDNVSFPGATKPPAVIPQITSRVTGISEANAAVGSTDGWAQYYAAGLRFFERGVTVGTTTTVSYTVTADGAPYANKTVHLLLGKAYSGSNAKVSVNGVEYTGQEKSIDLVTDANGVVTFTVVNTNVTAEADPFQANNVLHPAQGKHLFVQLALVGEKGNQDVLDILDLNYYQDEYATPPVTYNVRLADWNATNSFDGTHVWGDGGLGSWFPAGTGYFAHYVAAGSTFNLKYSVKNEAGVNAPNGTVVTLRLGTAWSGSNAKFTVNGVEVDGLTKWGANGQLDQATTTATVQNGFITLSVTSTDLEEDATPNPGSATANPDTLNPLFMQVQLKVEGNANTNQDWINIVVAQKAAAPTISSVSATSGKSGQAVDIVGTNFSDAMSATTVSLYTPATSKLPAVTTAVRVIAVSADGTRLTVASPYKTQKGYLKVTHAGGTASATTLLSASTSTTSKPSITFAASAVKEIGETFNLSGTNIASSSSIKIGTVSAPFTVVNASTVSVTVPGGVVSGSKISATNAGGTTTTTKLVYQAAVITTATASGRVGDTVTITGKNLVATAISFAGNKTGKAIIKDGNTLTFLVPTGALTGPIKITTGAGAIYTDSFTVVPPAPKVTSFTPTTGKKGVTVVSVKGTNLLGATVTIGSVAVTLSAGATATSFKFVVPAGASTGKINVTTAGGTVSSATNLTVTN